MAQQSPTNEEEKKVNQSEEILWCDSDPNIRHSATLIIKFGFKIKTFNETADCLKYIKQHPDQNHIKAVITSSMRRGGRKEKGLLDGLEMFDALRDKQNDIWRCSHAPILAVVTAGGLAVDECAEKGIKIIASCQIINNVRKFVQERVLNILGSFDTQRKMMQLAFSSEPQQSCHENRSLCWEFLQSLINPQNWNIYYDAFGNHCFCNNCEQKGVYFRGNPPEKYVLPIGWYRFGIKVRKDLEKWKLKMESWPVAYHGTPTDRVESIMEHQRIMFPGDKLNNGTILPIRLNACWAQQVTDDGKVIYCSPTINYAGHPNYARPRKWKNGSCGQIVFQCRVKPKCYKKFPETLGRKNYDPQINDKEIEWVTADRKGIAPYAVLIRILPQNAFSKRYMD